MNSLKTKKGYFSNRILSDFRNSPRVYVVKGGPCLKIGFTNDIRIRLKGMQGQSPLKLSCIAIFEGDSRLEEEIHRRVNMFRSHCEWFHNNRKIRKILNSYHSIANEVKLVNSWLEDTFIGLDWHEQRKDNDLRSLRKNCA